MDQLIVQRSYSVATIVSISNFVIENAEVCSIHQYESTLEELVDSYTDFKHTSSQIVDLIASCAHQMNQEFTLQVQKKFYATKTLLNQFIEELTSHNSCTDPSGSQPIGLDSQITDQPSRLSCQLTAMTDHQTSAQDTLTSPQKVQYTGNTLNTESLNKSFHSYSSTSRSSHVDYEDTVHKSNPSYIRTVPQCIVPSEMHPVYRCQTSKGWNVISSPELVITNSSSFNCLSSPHVDTECTSRNLCGYVNSCHPKLLQLLNNPQDGCSSNSSPPSLQPQESSEDVSSNHSSSFSSTIAISPDMKSDGSLDIPPINVLYVEDSNGKELSVITPIEKQSQPCLITDKFIGLLGLPNQPGVKDVYASVGKSFTYELKSACVTSKIDQAVNSYKSPKLSKRFEFKDYGNLHHLKFKGSEFSSPRHVDKVIEKLLSTTQIKLFNNNHDSDSVLSIISYALTSSRHANHINSPEDHQQKAQFHDKQTRGNVQPTHSSRCNSITWTTAHLVGVFLRTQQAKGALNPVVKIVYLCFCTLHNLTNSKLSI